MLRTQHVRSLTIAALLLVVFISQASVGFTSSIVCYGDTTLFINQSNVAKPANVDWDTDNDGFFNNGSGDTLKYVFANADTQYVRLRITDSLGVAFYSTVQQVIVNPNPEANFYFVGACLGQLTRFTNQSTSTNNSTLSYQWFFDAGNTVDATDLNPEKQFASIGINSVKLIALSSQGCSNTFQIPIEILAVPVSNFVAETTCNGQPSRFLNQSTFSSGTIANNVWKFGDGSLTFSVDTALHTYQSSGSFDVTLQVVAQNGCSDSSIQTITITPNATYAYTFSNDSNIFENASTQVEVTGDFTSIIWDNNSTSTTRILNDTGAYFFTVSSGTGCSVTQNLFIGRKAANGALQKANDFLTPNGDGKNDVLFFQNIEEQQPCKLRVYDINGLEVVNSEDYKNDWNGSAKGKEQAAGVYYYFLKCNGIKEMKGHTNIIR